MRGYNGRAASYINYCPVFFQKIISANVLNLFKNKTYKNFELIIVDGMSKDKTVGIIKQYQKNDKRIRLVNNPDDDIQHKLEQNGLSYQMVILLLSLTQMIFG